MATRLEWQTTWQGWSCSTALHVCLLGSFSLVFNSSPETMYRLGVNSATVLTMELATSESNPSVPPTLELDVAVAPAAARIHRREYRLDLNTQGELEASTAHRDTELGSFPSLAIPLERRELAVASERSSVSELTELPKLLPRKPTQNSGAVRIPHPPSTVVRSPEFVENRPPIYPRQAIAQGWQGTVWLRLRIGQDGNMLEVSVDASSGHAILDAAAVAAVRQWRAMPIDDGTATVVRLPVRFEIP
ncbi:MAG: energy transducer TonB [Planctomycetota bacterium]|nr:energy transducer TonB [Planctomycetota bacterium]MDA1177365.1 energy transducer TonB [Planctomycetota bacterium]